MAESPLIRHLVSEETIASEPWPSDALLYQPYEAEQILLAENASCLAVKAYLKMCDLPYEVKASERAEYMSPGGKMTKLPFMKVGAYVVAEFEPIVKLVEAKDVSLNSFLDSDQISDMRAYISLVENIFTNAELYVSYVDPIVYAKVTYPRSAWGFPWPLNTIESWDKKRRMIGQLHMYNWLELSIDDVAEKVRKCCETLSEKLESNLFFYGSRPTELDAITFGHLYSILTTQLPNDILARTVQKFENLSRLCKNIDAKFFKT